MEAPTYHNMTPELETQFIESLQSLGVVDMNKEKFFDLLHKIDRDMGVQSYFDQLPDDLFDINNGLRQDPDSEEYIEYICAVQDFICDELGLDGEDDVVHNVVTDISMNFEKVSDAEYEEDDEEE